MSITPLSIDNIHCNRPMAERSLPSKYVPQTVPQRKQSVFVAPSGLSSIIAPPPPPPPPPPLKRQLASPQNKSSLAKPNAQILEQHISKIISENAAIVETLDPLWSKRYISRNSTSVLPNLSLNGISVQSSHPMSPNETTSGQRRFSEVDSNQPLSKLQSALLGRSVSQTSPPNRKYCELSSPESPQQQQSVIINAKDSNNNHNNNHNNKHNNNIIITNNSKDCNNVFKFKTTNSLCVEHLTSDSIVRNLLTTKTAAIQVTPTDKTSPSLASHPQNPEGSIIKDLLLKSRDEGRKQSRSEGQCNEPVPEQESSMLVYVCTVCNIAFRNKENLEVHQIHYCKGNDDMSDIRPSKHKMEDIVQRKVSVMARPGFGGAAKQYQHQRQSSTKPLQQKLSTSVGPTPPIGNILKQQLLAPNEGHPPLKKRKTSEPVFRTTANSSDIQIIEDNCVRRISVVQSIQTTKSNHALEASVGAPIASLPTISSSHTVIQPVLNSGATVIENSLSQQMSNIPICYVRCGDSAPHMTTTTQPVPFSAVDLVNNRPPIEILAEYLPHVNRPKTKITFKGPIVFPVLKNLCVNGINPEFAVDECATFKPIDTTSNEGKTTMNAFRQVASLPIQTTNTDKYNGIQENDDEMEILNKENEKQLTPISSPNGLVLPKATGAVRPRTLSLRTSNGSNLISSTLVSPDTPRPNKTCVELYMNGHAYSRIGFKVTPRPVYCTMYKTQPMFVQQETDPTLSMYSNWTTTPLAADDIMNVAPPPVILGSYDSRLKQRVDSMVIMSAGKTDLNSTHSSYWQFRNSDEEKENLKLMINKLRQDVGENVEEVYRKLSEEVSASSAFSADTDSEGGDAAPPKRVRIFEGGFKSNEDYTYVRGRGRGKYVCEECGIRCKKPSMLKKHIRTHTDLRPYSCRHCAFAFKTKGNLTKHMKSKAHHKKCVELGIIPVPITIDDSQIDTDALAKQEMLEISCGGLPEDEDEDDDEGEWDEDEEEEDDEGVPIPLIEMQKFDGDTCRTVPGQFDDADPLEVRARAVSESGSAATEAEEQEAARSLLILSGSGSESDVTNVVTGARKTSVITEEFLNKEKRKVSVIDRRISQQVMEDQKRRVSQVLEAEHQRRVSHHMLEAEQQRRISSQQLDPICNSADLSDFHSTVTTMKPPTEPLPPPPPPLIISPRKLSPIEQLQQQVQQQQQFMQNTWTPNCDQLSRPRSYSFNDVPLIPTRLFEPTSHPTIDPMECLTDESSDESLDSFASRRYSMSIIGEHKFGSQSKQQNHLSAVVEREEPMDLSVSAKSTDVSDGIVLPPISHSEATVVKVVPTSLRQGEFIPTAPQRAVIETIDGKSICSICSKQFSKPSQLRLHINIHYFERPFRCDSCAVSFRTKGHLQKHKRSVSHFNKVNMNMTFGTPTTDNPRPFKCADCKIAFRIHGHLAKHLRSKMHIMKLECLGKLPFGMYAEMERSGVNLNEIDTTDCENSLQSLQLMAQRLYDPRQMRWASEPIPENETSYDDPSNVKNEPNEQFYNSLVSDRQSNTNHLSTEPHVSAPLIQSDALIAKSPPPPLVIESLPIEPSPPPPPLAQTGQPSSGFTSTRSNTCHLCGRLFKAAKFLQVHLYCDHPESPSPQMNENHDFECDICHKEFSDVSVLQQHMVSHTSARPYVCDICDAGFISALLLGSHLQTHHPLT